MRIFHTSDWHVGRTFHGYSTLDATREVLGTIPAVVRDHDVDVVLVSGDIYDLANPSADAVAVLRDAVRAILDTGATVVMTSGNHDSAVRLGFAGAFSTGAGLHLLTDPVRIHEPVELADAHGPVDVYALPYLQPELVRGHAWAPTGIRTQNEVVTAAMDHVRAEIVRRRTAGRRSVVLAHTFVAGGHAESSDSERAITREPLVAGGVDAVPLEAFAGVDYAALGHIHGRMALADHVRYSGAPVHYSFGEAGKSRGGWLVTLGADGLTDVGWVDLPVPRPLQQVTGPFADLLVDPSLDAYADHYVRAVYTDRTRQIEPMRKLRERFPWCAEVVWEPAERVTGTSASYTERVTGKTDPQVVASFLADVRAGEGPSAAEDAIIDAVIDEHAARDAR